MGAQQSGDRDEFSSVDSCVARPDVPPHTAYLFLSYPFDSETRQYAEKASKGGLSGLLNNIATDTQGRDITWTLTSLVQTGYFSMQQKDPTGPNDVIVVQMYHNGLPTLPKAVELVTGKVADLFKVQTSQVEVLTYTNAASGHGQSKRR